MALFYPRGGESLVVETTRPEGTEGSTLAFDSVVLQANHGDRSSDVTMVLEYRSTRGSQHVVRIPENAEVTSVVTGNICGRIQARFCHMNKSPLHLVVQPRPTSKTLPCMACIDNTVIY